MLQNRDDQQGKHVSGFSLIELLVVISIVAILIGILLPAVGQARKSARQTMSATQVRGIHSGLILYAQHSNLYYPGLDNNGNPTAPTAAERFEILIGRDFFAPAYAISPLEQKEVWYTGSMTTANFSFALLQIASVSDDYHRRREWRDTGNPRSIMVSDRNLSASGDPPVGIQTGPTGGQWLGNVGWNDNHVTYALTHIAEQTQYNEQPTNTTDDLFDGTGNTDPDAVMIYN